MPVMKFRVVYKNKNKYEESWDWGNPRIYWDNKAPQKFKQEHEDWAAANPGESFSGVLCYFYTHIQETGEFILNDTVKFLNLKKQPRILNDDPRQTPLQEKNPSNMAGEEEPTFGTHAHNDLGEFIENDF